MNFARLTWICLLSIVLCSACGGKSDDKETAQLTSYDSLREKIISRVEKGELAANASGVISLPDELKTASNDAQAYMSNDANAGFLIAFNVSMSPQRKEFLLHGERALAENVKAIQVGPLNLTVAGKLGDHWYRAIAR